ncbi:hypothetical protein ACFM35_00035 [Microbacterium sp. P01]|uniref:hypothetical protein n=1 Tax=Microbacterium sp. P01 TaxID=3366261 RepID=UPI00366AFA51
MVKAPVAPVALNFSGDVAAVVICLNDIDVNAINVKYRETNADWVSAMETSTDQIQSGLELQRGDAIIVGEPLGALEFATLAPIPTAEQYDAISVQIEYLQGDEWGYVWVTFPNVERSRMSEDQYLYEDGTLADRPCEMTSTDQSQGRDH